jgi:hypothetical protein
MQKKKIRADFTPWIKPRRRKYRFVCCDCGLSHFMNFALRKNDHGRGKMIVFQIARDDKGTSYYRNGMKFKKQGLWRTK